MKTELSNTTKIKSKRLQQRWKRRIVRYRQKFQAYMAYIVIIALFSIVAPFIIFYHFERQAILAIGIFSFAVVVYIALAKREFVDKISWMMIVIFLPFFGVFLFLFIGLSQLESRTYQQKIKIDSTSYQRYQDYITSLSSTAVLAHVREHDLLHYYNIAEDASYTTDNNFSFLESQAVYDKMLEDINKAKHHIHLEMYIARFDETTKPILDALKRKAKEGVRVRYLGDVFGHNLLREKSIEELILAGIEFTFFNSKSGQYFDHFHVNHRKMLIVDGEVGYTGGYNLGAEYVHGYPHKHLLWYDMMARIEGNVVHPMQLMFLLDWSFSHQIDVETILEGKEAEYFPQKLVILSEEKPITQFMGDGPDREKTKVKDSLRYLISRAKHRIYITTPYLIPSDDLINDLKLAAKSGVDIRIIIPAVPDKKSVYYCTESYIESFLAVGIKIYKMDGHFIHSKIYIFDDDVSMFGTVNFDMRSFLLNFEENIIQFNDKRTNKALETIFVGVENKSTIIDESTWKKRSIFQRILELFFRAFAPLF